MSSNQNIIEKRHVFADCDDKYICKVRRNDHNYRQVYEYDKKLKREIANSNERRRMQSINMGFETLKQLLPMTIEGEKLSKASILQFTAKYIQTLISRLTTLEREVASYKRSMLNNKDKILPSKSTLSVMQEHNRKRRLNSCTVEFEIAQTELEESIHDISTTNNYTILTQNDSPMNCHASEKTPGSLEHLVAAIEQVEGEKFYISTNDNDLQSQIMNEEINSDSWSIIESNNDAFEITEQNLQPIPSNVNIELNNPENSNSPNNIINTNINDSSVMKPTISPYTEKIILAVSQNPHMFENRPSNYSLNIATQPTYQLLSNEHLLVSSGSHRNFLGSPRISTVPQTYVHKPDDALEKNHSL